MISSNPRISSGSAPQINDVSGFADEHAAVIAPSSGHGTASDQRTTRAATNAISTPAPMIPQCADYAGRCSSSAGFLSEAHT